MHCYSSPVIDIGGTYGPDGGGGIPDIPAPGGGAIPCPAEGGPEGGRGPLGGNCDPIGCEDGGKGLPPEGAEKEGGGGPVILPVGPLGGGGCMNIGGCGWPVFPPGGGCGCRDGPGARGGW